MPIGRCGATLDSRGGGDRAGRSGVDYVPCESAVLSAAEDGARLGGSCRRRDFAGSRGVPAGTRCAALAQSLLGICSGDRALLSVATLCPGAKIGNDFFAHAHAVVREYCRIGDRVILQNGVIIGGDGFGFAHQNDGTWYKMLQSGPAVLGDDVEG